MGCFDSRSSHGKLVTSLDELTLFFCLIDCVVVSEVRFDNSKLSFGGFCARVLTASEALLSEEDELEWI